MALESLLARWYSRHRRDLPWRRTRDPYRIWISEIIMQQTRVDQGLPYYRAFLSRFPDINTLARASEEDVLRAWQGLGYYSRARHLHATARLVAAAGGVFPREAAALRKLPGIGEYTAAAIASFAFDQPEPLVDGNVIRFLSRHYGIKTAATTGAGKKKLWALAAEILDRRHPARHNQAIMEFGALQCVPAAPDCSRCPFKKTCRAFLLGQVDRFPVRTEKKAPRTRYFHYFFVRWNGHTVLQRRGGGDIWRHLYEFPLVETPRPQRMSAAHLARAGVGQRGVARRPEKSGSYRHVLSHQVLHADFFDVTLTARPRLAEGLALVPLRSMGKYPVPRLIEKHLQASGR